MDREVYRVVLSRQMDGVWRVKGQAMRRQVENYHREKKKKKKKRVGEIDGWNSGDRPGI